LWITREFDYPSQSFSAIYENLIFYYLMHLSIMLTFAFDFLASSVDKSPTRWLSLLPPLFGTLVIEYDMHYFPTEHNIATALLMASAVFNLIYYASTAQERIYAIVISVAGAVMFPIGMFTEVSLFWTEVIAEACIGIGLARRIYLEDRT
jgi:hypothetical protein